MKLLILQILPLLLGAAISPVAISGTILVLASKDHPRSKGLIYVIGAMLPLLFIGIAGLMFFSKIDFAAFRPNAQVTNIVDIIAGVALLILAARHLHPAKTKPEKTASDIKKRSSSNGSSSYDKALFLGIALMFVNFTTLILFIPAVKAVSDASLALADKATVLLIAIMIVMSLISTPLIIYLLFPSRASQLLGAMHKWITKHNREVMLAMLTVFGGYLILKGFSIL
ncbi:GAP family protein [Candidatus Saccharibacteria bacterium]|nr:GAP family protein [Candidatus Saccharibacteria bacterium]